MADDSEDDRKQLLDRFLAEIAQGSGNVFFDEDDLVEMYDYAADTNDDYARMELLLCASRLYPSSEALGERKAFSTMSLAMTPPRVPPPRSCLIIPCFVACLCFFLTDLMLGLLPVSLTI